MVLGIDYGKSRVGLAKGETDLGLSFPYMVLKNDLTLIKRLKQLIEEEDIKLIVVGMPFRADVDDNVGNDFFSEVKAFVKELNECLSLEIVTLNEAYSSFEALEKFNSQNYRKGKKSLELDAYAAQVILQRYFDVLDS